jgi:hypothetical protein
MNVSLRSLRSTSTTIAMSCMGIMFAVREAIPKARDLAIAEFATLRLRLIKIAARVIETASRCGSPRRLMSRSRSVPHPAGCAHPTRTVKAGA